MLKRNLELNTTEKGKNSKVRWKIEEENIVGLYNEK